MIDYVIHNCVFGIGNLSGFLGILREFPKLTLIWLQIAQGNVDAIGIQFPLELLSPQNRWVINIPMTKQNLSFDSNINTSIYLPN